MKYILGLLLLPFTISAFSQTYSCAKSDYDIIQFINQIASPPDKRYKPVIHRKMIKLSADDFYYKDSTDFKSKSRNNPYFFFKKLIINGREISFHVDSLFSRKDIDYFLKQIKCQKETEWFDDFKNVEMIESITMDSLNRVERTVNYYSIPLFSVDKRRVIIMNAFFCGLLCGGGKYLVYEKTGDNKWKKIREINVWAE